MHFKRTQKISSVQAFTIVEVAMAMVVTLVAVVGLIQAVTIGSEMLDLSHKQTIAMQLIRNELDNVRLQSWATVSAFTDVSMTLKDDGTGPIASTTAATKQTFALTNYSSTATGANTNLMLLAKGFTLALDTTVVKANLVQLKYTVSWTAGNRQKTYSRSGTTYYGKNGLNTYYTR